MIAIEKEKKDFTLVSALPGTKQETFMLGYSVPSDVICKTFPVNHTICKQQFKFRIHGYLHSSQVFTDEIFYVLKGGKLLNCCLTQVNETLFNMCE